MKNSIGTPSTSYSLLFVILAMLVGDVHALAVSLYNLINALTLAGRKGMHRGGGGRGLGNVGGHLGNIKALLVIIILVLVIPAIALIFSGPTTGSTGVYGNSTVSAAVRGGTVSFSQFIGIIMIVGAVIVLVGLLG